MPGLEDLEGLEGYRQRIPRPPGIRSGEPPPWAGLPPDARGPISLDRVRKVMASVGPSQVVPDPAYAPGRHDPLLPHTTPGRPSAVLVALFPDAAPPVEGEAHVILTRRSSRLRSHTGEVSFPGGRIDPGEQPVAAALREASEEIGLDPDQVEILGQLAPLSTVSSGSFITPFVGVLPGRPHLRPNPAEVELALEVALSSLVQDGVYRGEMWQAAGGASRPMHFFAVGEDLVWGATARVLHQLLELVYLGPR